MRMKLLEVQPLNAIEFQQEFGQEWDFMQRGITKLKNILERLPEPPFTSEEYIMLYTTIYHMCSGKTSQQLYAKYRESFEEYLTATVIPSLREKHGEVLLRELVKRWSNHKVMVHWLSRIFFQLEKYLSKLPGLKEAGHSCFRNLVTPEINVKVMDAVMSLIDRERRGEPIDRALLKNVLDVCVEIGMGLSRL